MPQYKVKSYTPELMEELAQICFNLRYYTKRWKEHYGAENRVTMERWQARMDKFLEENIEKISD